MVFDWALGVPTGLQSTVEFCSIEPTGDLPTDLDWAALAFPPVALITGAYRRFGNQLRAWKFAELCQCVGNLEPSCLSTSFSYTGASWTGATATGVNIEWGSPFTALQDLQIFGITGYSRPSGDLGARDLHIFNHAGTLVALHNGHLTPPGIWTWTLDTPLVIPAGETWLISETTLSSNTVACSSGSDFPSNAFITWLPTRYTLSPGAYPTTVGGTTRLALIPSVCGDASPTPVDPPPDAEPPDDWPEPVLGPEECNDSYVCSTLYAIDRKLDVIGQLLLDHMNRGTPYGYRLGAAHPGLTGSGVVAVSGAVGCVVTLTTVPVNWGQTTAVPRRLLPAAGQLQWSAAEGEFEMTFLHYEAEVIFSKFPGATGITYSLRPGIVATITELLAPV